MAYVSTARGWWRFNQSLGDNVATADFDPGSGVTAAYQQFRRFDINANTIQTRYGLLLESGSTYSADISGSFVVGSAYTLALSMLYYSPNALGRTRHATTRETTPKIAPIVAKANTTISSGDESITASQGEWILSEIGYSKTQNAIQLAVCGGNSDPTDIYVSEPYTPGFITVFVTIIYSATSNYARIDINGEFGEQHTTLANLQTPSSTVAPIRLNDIGFGLTAHKVADEERYIADLVLKANGETTSAQTVNVSRFGPTAILDTNSESNKTVFLGIGYTQPETVTTTQIYSEGGHVFVTRSNGEILEGHKPIWANDFTFKNRSSINRLTASQTGLPPQWTPGGLRLQGTTIRI